MKQIELTEEHKSKLLEICKVLFPEKGSIELEIKPQYDGSDGFIIFEDMNGDYNNAIHWFEFCMTHLAEKIIATYKTNINNEKVYKRTLNDDLSKFYLESLNFSRGYSKHHPVDYLYTEFKKLK